MGDQQQYKYMTVDDMKSLGDDSMKMDVTHDEKGDYNRNSLGKSFPVPGCGGFVIFGCFQLLRISVANLSYNLNKLRSITRNRITWISTGSPLRPGKFT